MPVIYNNQPLIPAPLVDANKSFIRGENGLILAQEYVFILRGTIVNTNNNYSSPGTTGSGIIGQGPITLRGYGDMEGVLAEQKRIRQIFAYDGGRLEIESPGGGGPDHIDAFCTVESIDFSDSSTWNDRCTYTIVLRSKQILGDSGDNISNYLQSMSESFSISENEENIYTINHRVQAVGLPIYVDPPIDPLLMAKAWCRSRLFVVTTNGILIYPSGIIGPSQTSGIISGPFSLNATLSSGTGPSGISSQNSNYWNYALAENIGRTNYSWEANETFIYNKDGSTKEIWSASVNFENNDQRRCAVSINGFINGYSDKVSNLDSRNQNALLKFNSVQPNFYTRAISILPSGYVVVPTPTTSQVTYDRSAGSIKYNYTYYAAFGSGLITNSIEEDITISDTGGTDIFAQINIPGKVEGPVLQYMNTCSAPERTVSITATIANPIFSGLSIGSLRSLYLSKPNTDDIVKALQPEIGFFYVKQNTEQWNPLKKQYSRTISWIVDPALPSGIPSLNNVHNVNPSGGF